MAALSLAQSPSTLRSSRGLRSGAGGLVVVSGLAVGEAVTHEGAVETGELQLDVTISHWHDAALTAAARTLDVVASPVVGPLLVALICAVLWRAPRHGARRCAGHDDGVRLARRVCGEAAPSPRTSPDGNGARPRARDRSGQLPLGPHRVRGLVRRRFGAGPGARRTLDARSLVARCRLRRGGCREPSVPRGSLPRRRRHLGPSRHGAGARGHSVRHDVGSPRRSPSARLSAPAESGATRTEIPLGGMVLSSPSGCAPHPERRRPWLTRTATPSPE